MDTETKAVRDGAGGSRVAAANAEYRRWGTGGDSRRPPGERAWACRQNDNGSWQITTYHRNEREADEARHEQALAAATGAALAAPSAAGGGAIPEGWALLPLEATEAMWQAGRDADAHPTDSYSAVWDAMIAAAPSPSQGSDTGEAGRDPKGSDHSRAEPSGALHDAIAEIVQRAGDDPAQHFLRRTIARRNEERAAALKQTAAEPASSAVQGGAGDRTVLPRGAADISASPAPRHENGEAGETGTGSTECIGSVGRQAETPDYLTGFAPYTPVTVRSGTAAPPPTAPQGADLAGLSAKASQGTWYVVGPHPAGHGLTSWTIQDRPNGGGKCIARSYGLENFDDARLACALVNDFRAGRIGPTTSVQTALAGGREAIAQVEMARAAIRSARERDPGRTIAERITYCRHMARDAVFPEGREGFKLEADSLLRALETLALAQAPAQTDTARKALVEALIWECDRAVKIAGGKGQYETCFRALLEKHLDGKFGGVAPPSDEPAPPSVPAAGRAEP